LLALELFVRNLAKREQLACGGLLRTPNRTDEAPKLRLTRFHLWSGPHGSDHKLSTPHGPEIRSPTAQAAHQPLRSTNNPRTRSNLEQAVSSLIEAREEPGKVIVVLWRRLAEVEPEQRRWVSGLCEFVDPLTRVQTPHHRDPRDDTTQSCE
jgi:hypothetical protein